MFFFLFSDPPIVSIELGSSLVAADIRQGNDVYFDCNIQANPEPKSKIVTWLHNVSQYVALLVLKRRLHIEFVTEFVLPP